MNSCRVIACLNIMLLIMSCASPYLTNGKTQFENKNYEMAMIELTKALEVTPDNLEVHYYLGLTYYVTHKYDLAMREFTFIKQKNPGFPGLSSWLEETRIKVALKSTSSWDEFKGQLVDMSTDFDQYEFIIYNDVSYFGEVGYLLLKGFEFKKSGELEKSLLFFLRCVELRPNEVSVKSMVNYSASRVVWDVENVDDLKAAVSIYRRYLQLSPDDQDMRKQMSTLEDKLVILQKITSLQHWVADEPAELSLEEVLSLAKKMKTESNMRPQAISVLKHFQEQYADHELADEALYELGACIFREPEPYGEALQIFKTVQTDNDTLEAKTLYMIARCYREMERFQKAEEYYRQVAEHHPGFRLADDALFLVGYMNKDYAQAVPIYREVIEKFPDGDVTDGAAARLGWILYTMEQYDEAITVTTNLLQDYPESENRFWWGYRYLIYSYQSKQDYKSLELTLGELLEESPGLGKRKIVSLAKLYYYKLNDPERAKKVLTLIPGWEDDNHIKALSTFFDTGDFQMYLHVANPIRREIEFKSDDSQELFQAAVETRNSTQAIDFLHKALKMEPPDTLTGRIKYQIGKELMRAGEYWEAVKIFDTLESPEIEIEVKSEFSLGKCYRRLGEKEMAHRVFDDIAQAPWNEGYKEYALYELARMQYDASAIEDYLNIIIDTGNHHTSTLRSADWLTRIYYKLHRDYRGTVQVVEQRLEESLDSAVPAGARYYRGLALTYLGETEEAASVFEELFELSNYYSIQGLCSMHDYSRYELGDLAAARDIISQARSIFTGDSFWLSNMIALREKKYEM